MESSDKNATHLYISLFGSVIVHSLILLLIFLNFPSFERTNKTIPFQLVQNQRIGSNSNSAQLSQSENALAAQEFLRSLNAATFEQLINENTKKNTQKKQSNSPFKSDFAPDTPDLHTPVIPKNNNPESAFEGLQNIFSRNNDAKNQQNQIQQLSTKSLNDLSEYEIKLLQQLARNELYDSFHRVMDRYSRKQVDYTISLFLFPNGAIKNAQIKESTNIAEIDQLAIQAAFQASPFPKPPSEDVRIGFKYDIPIIYQKRIN